jgi:hypothetical protein
MSDDYINRLRQQLGIAKPGEEKKPDDQHKWNVGGVPNLRDPSNTDPAASSPPPENLPKPPKPEEGSIEADPPPGNDERIWTDPTAIEEDIDRLNKQAEQEDRVADADPNKKEERTDSLKQAGGKGSG